MIKVLLICAGGLSSSLLLKHIAAEADSAGVEIRVMSHHASGFQPWDFEKNPIDVVLIAPQVRFLKKRFARATKSFGAIVLQIDPTAYGMADGKQIVQQILESRESSAQ